MAEIIKFPRRKLKLDDHSKALLNLAGDIDVVIEEALRDGVLSGHDIAGVLAHRLGSLMSLLSQKPELWEICERVLKKQAKIV